MSKFENFYFTMPDGTLKHINPLTGTEVWTVPTRAHRPYLNRGPKPAKLQPVEGPESYCDFCRSRYFNTPPEKARLIKTSDGRYQRIERSSPDLIEASEAHFRRFANLFEIVTLDYWTKNHGFHFSPSQVQWRKNYLENPKGQAHVLQVVETKLRLSGKSPEEIAALSLAEKSALADPFFAGSHEVITAGRHFRPGAQWDNELVSSGDLTPEEHYWFLRFAIDGMAEIRSNNPFVRYVSVFQNWLHPAGASLDHLHKQLVGIDEWGTSIQEEMGFVKGNPNIYNELIIGLSVAENLVFAENDHAIAHCEIGHRYPTLAVYSKSRHARPDEHTEEELRGFSDLVHACHAAMGNQVPCNEEWYYSPWDTHHVMPWHILLKWRVINQAGFEGGTKIYINPMSPIALRDTVVPKLYELRDKGKIKNLRIATECKLEKNPLLYGQK